MFYAFEEFLKRPLQLQWFHFLYLKWWIKFYGNYWWRCRSYMICNNDCHLWVLRQCKQHSNLQVRTHIIEIPITLLITLCCSVIIHIYIYLYIYWQHKNNIFLKLRLNFQAAWKLNIVPGGPMERKWKNSDYFYFTYLRSVDFIKTLIQWLLTNR